MMYYAWQRDNASIIEVDNDLDGLALGSAIDVAARSGRTMIVSLEQCSFCDSTALDMLVNKKTRLGARLLVVVPPPNRKVFEITGLAHYLAVSASLAEVLATSTGAHRST